MPRKITGELAYQACLDNPETATRTLSRELYKDNPGVYSCVDHARSMIRIYRGQIGNKTRWRTKHRESYSKNGDNRRGDINSPVVSDLKILLFDIETAPHLAYVWRCFKENVNPAQMVQHTTLLCWAAKWLGKKAVLFDSAPHNDYTNDKKACQSLWELINEADIVVAHYGIGFDLKQMRTRWLAHGIHPPSPYQTVDTCKLAQARFAFPRSKLESLARYLGLKGKTSHTGFKLWTDCMAGDEKAWKLMEKYNKQDVVVLENIYLKLREWDNRHPNVSLEFDDVMRCISCGSANLVKLPNHARTTASIFDSYRCKDCGKVMRSRSRHKPKLSADQRLANVI